MEQIMAPLSAVLSVKHSRFDNPATRPQQTSAEFRERQRKWYLNEDKNDAPHHASVAAINEPTSPKPPSPPILVGLLILSTGFITGLICGILLQAWLNHS